MVSFSGHYSKLHLSSRTTTYTVYKDLTAWKVSLQAIRNSRTSISILLIRDIFWRLLNALECINTWRK